MKRKVIRKSPARPTPPKPPRPAALRDGRKLVNRRGAPRSAEEVPRGAPAQGRPARRCVLCSLENLSPGADVLRDCLPPARCISVPFLPVRDDFHPKRNQARQKLATLPTSRFKDLASDVFFELQRRCPELDQLQRRPSGAEPEQQQQRRPSGAESEQQQQRRPSGAELEQQQQRRPSGAELNQQHRRRPSGAELEQQQQQRPSGAEINQQHQRRPSGAEINQQHQRRPSGA
ncbi:MAG: hypothetical protein BJ554DRAFT_6756, partial [Olpidium bornovanus]